MTAPFHSIPHTNIFAGGRYSHGTVIDEYATARLSAAAQGIQAVLAVLHQRELDAETLNGEGVSFGPEVAQGLLAAAATCTNALATAVDGGGCGVAHAFHGTPAYAVLKKAHTDVMRARNEEGTV